MRSPTAKGVMASALSTLLILLFFFLLICASSSSSSPQLQSSVVMSRRLLSTQCRDASSCSTPLSGLSRFFKAPATVFESLKKMPKSRSNPSHN
ncbi:hypothetical protein HU200_058752 [Digitaria exilis]|uniref:Secreted protein n=1 Tax=Digitaria exilis TaxID=1010633 RepID=A0A835A989_9POAL|nr:hypothetical protein HU200_058752 [Digitaria exilis]